MLDVIKFGTHKAGRSMRFSFIAPRTHSADKNTFTLIDKNYLLSFVVSSFMQAFLN